MAEQILRQLSWQSSSGGHGMVSEELELLRNVYFQDLKITSETVPVLQLHVVPSTADDQDKQFVYLDVSFTLVDEYPSVTPGINIDRSRGLSDLHLQSISDGLLNLSNRHLGAPMIYDLVEYIRDCLTDNNRPCGQCPLCLFDFQEDEKFLRTECYHYFHSDCLARFLRFYSSSECDLKEEPDSGSHTHPCRSPGKQLSCPVCRLPIEENHPCLHVLSEAPLGEEEGVEPVFTASVELRRWQDSMSRLFQKQLEQGGIIDLACQDQVIDDTWVSSTISVEGKAILAKKRQHGIKDPTIRQSVTGELVTERGESACREMTSPSSRGKREHTDRVNPQSRYPHSMTKATVSRKLTWSQGERGGHKRGFCHRHGDQDTFGHVQTQLHGGSGSRCERGLHYHGIGDQESLNYEQAQSQGGEHGRSDRGFRHYGAHHHGNRHHGAHHHGDRHHGDQDSCQYVNGDIGPKSSHYHHGSCSTENPANHGYFHAQCYHHPRQSGDAYKTKSIGHVTREESFVKDHGNRQHPSSQTFAKPSGSYSGHAEQLYKQPRERQRKNDNPITHVSESSHRKDNTTRTRSKEMSDRPHTQHKVKESSGHHRQPWRMDKQRKLHLSEC